MSESEATNLATSSSSNSAKKLVVKAAMQQPAVSETSVDKYPVRLLPKPPLTLLGMETSKMRQRSSSNLPLRLITLPGCSIVGTALVASTPPIRAPTPAYYLSNYQPISSTGYMQSMYMPYQRRLILEPFAHEKVLQVPIKNGQTPAKNHQLLAAIEKSMKTSSIVSSKVSASKDQTKKIDREIQTAPLGESNNKASCGIGACHQTECESSLRAVVAKQRRLITQLVKIIVKNKLEGGTPRDSTKRNDDYSKTYASSCKHDTASASKSDGITVGGTTSLRTCKEERTEYTPGIGLSLSRETDLERITDADRSTSANVERKRISTTTANAELLELGRRILELLSPHGNSTLTTLRTEFSHQLESLKQEFDNNSAAGFEKRVVCQDSQEASSARRADIYREGQAQVLPKSETTVEHFFPEACRKPSSGAIDNEVIVIDDVEDDPDFAPATVPETTADVSTPNKEPSRNISGPPSSGKGKRRKHSSANDCSYVAAKVKEEEDLLDIECRRSPRKRPKTTPSRAYVRRSASKQATKKITNLLKDSDSEFSPLSDDSSNSDTGTDEGRKARRKLLPPDLDFTLRDFDDQGDGKVASGKSTKQDQVSDVGNPPNLFRQIPYHPESNSHDQIDWLSTQSPRRREDESFTWNVPRSIASSTPLPILQEPPTSAEASFQPIIDLRGVCRDQLSNGAVNMTYAACEPLNLTSRSTIQRSVESAQTYPSVFPVADSSVELALDLSIPKPANSNDLATEKDAQDHPAGVEFVARNCESESNHSEYDHEFKTRDYQKAFVTLSSQTTQHKNAEQPAGDILPRLGFDQLLTGNNLASRGASERSLRRQQAFANTSASYHDGGDLHIDERTDSDAWEPAVTQKSFQEFDFTETSPSENSLRHWLSKRRNIPSSLFSLARGHGVGFLRPGRSPHLRSEPGVGVTAKSLRKVARAKGIWKKNAASGKLIEYIPPGIRKRWRGECDATRKDRVLHSLTNMPSALVGGSSRNDESSDGIENQKRAKKLKKRREYRRSNLGKNPKANPSKHHSDCSYSSRGIFPFETASESTGSSEIEVVSESSPSLCLWKDSFSDMAALHLPDSPEINSPALKLPLSEENITHCEELDNKIAVSTQEDNCCRDQIKIMERAISEFRDEINELGDDDRTGKNMEKSLSPVKMQNEIDMALSGTTRPNFDNGAREAAAKLISDQYIKEEAEEYMAFPTAASCTEERSDHNGISSLYSEYLTGECVVNISPLKYRRSGSKWVPRDRSTKLGRSPLRKTFVRTNDTYSVRDTTDEENLEKQTDAKEDKRCELESESSDFSTQSCEIDIAEWTMIPRRACEEAKQKISKLVRNPGKVQKASHSPRNQQPNITKTCP